MTKRTGRARDGAAIPERIGLATLTRVAFSGVDLDPIRKQLLLAFAMDAADAGALMDLSVIEQLTGNPDGGLALQATALDIAPCFRLASRSRGTVKVLALAAPIHMGGNTPVEFLTTGTGIALTTLYIAPGMPLPDPLPEHDIAFVAAPGDSNAFRRFLTEIERRVTDWPRPVLNHPRDIVKLERDSLCALLSDVPGLTLPGTARCDRGTLAALGSGEADLADVAPGIGFPLVVRPVGAHAGRNLECLADAGEIGAYLDACDDPDFFLSDYIDYGSIDGQFRKYRIVFVDGHPLPCHMAIADRWKVWYMNAEMEGSAAKRAEEARFMASFQDDFAERHRHALTTIAGRLGLDYFGIDCAEDRDGNLVLFEADNALIVHDMDSEEVYPYKKPHMHAIFRAFGAMAKGRAGLTRTRAAMRSTG